MIKNMNTKLSSPTLLTFSQTEDSEQEIQDKEYTILPNQTISQFLANLDHELRTPMIGILGSVDLLEHSTLNYLQMTSVETIRECGERLLIAIDDILEACKIDTGLVDLNPSYTNLPHLVKKTIDALETNLANKKLLLKLDLDGQLPGMVMVDQAKLRQIIVNLLSNAIKFTPSGGINVSARAETAATGETWLLISVTDTGIGIPQNQLGSIFNCFTQGDSSSSRQFGGNGLGLYICQKLITLMGGRMWVKSTEGMGSTFSFKIPVEITAEKKQPEAAAQVAAMLEDDVFNSGFSPISVLLVDDNDLNQKLLGQMLLSYGFEVTTAGNGLECLSILQRKNIDIVLMDMQMPVMDGYEATRLIRKNPSWQQLPIIAITANSLYGDRSKCLNCGCSSYLAKPFKSEALIREIKSYLKNQFIKDKNSERLSKQLIAELMPEFMEMLNEMLNELKEAIDLKDLPGIKQISHGLKGTAGMYGFMPISELAALIENAIADKNYPRMKLLHQQITAFAKEINMIEKSGVM
jgi:Signal transduction histidine kinase